jgi:histidinol-phosphate aminotransferase
MALGSKGEPAVARLRDALRDLGFTIDDSHGNFVWLALDDSLDWAVQCADLGILVRGYPDAGLRVTIATGPGNDQFLTAAAKLPRR